MKITASTTATQVMELMGTEATTDDGMALLRLFRMMDIDDTDRLTEDEFIFLAEYATTHGNDITADQEARCSGIASRFAL